MELKVGYLYKYKDDETEATMLILKDRGGSYPMQSIQLEGPYPKRKAFWNRYVDDFNFLVIGLSKDYPEEIL